MPSIYLKTQTELPNLIQIIGESRSSVLHQSTRTPSSCRHEITVLAKRQYQETFLQHTALVVTTPFSRSRQRRCKERGYLGLPGYTKRCNKPHHIQGGAGGYLDSCPAAVVVVGPGLAQSTVVGSWQSWQRQMSRAVDH